MSAPQRPDDPNNETHPLDYLIVLAKNSHLILLTSAAVAVLTYLILFCLPNKYTATTRLLPPQQNMTLSAQLLEAMGGGVTPGKVGSGSALSNVSSGLLGLKSPNALYVGMLNSDTVLDNIIARFDLRKIFKTRYIEDARRSLLGIAKISDRKEGLISIEVTDKDPKRAAAIANAFGEELDRLLRQLTAQEARSRLAFLEKERVQASENLTKAEETLRSFSEKSGVIQMDAQAKGALEYIARLRAEIDAKEVQIKVLRQRATSANYDVIRLETELKGLREKLQSAEISWDQTCLGDVCLATSKVPALGLEYIRIYREAKFHEALFQLYGKLGELARLDEVRDVVVVQMVDRATPPEKRSNRRFFPAVTVGICTFFLMIFVAFGKEHLLQLKEQEDTVQRLEVLGSYFKDRGGVWERIWGHLAKFKKPSQ